VTARNSFRLKREPKAVRDARDALDGLDGHFPQARVYDASLCLSELVSNAVRHPETGGELELTVAVEGDRLRVEVADEGGGFEPHTPARGDERGWGLFIVDSLADTWGVTQGDRTVVWFEMHRQEEPDAAGEAARATAGGARDDRLLRAAALRLRVG
jgi:anti-sigma regulatory factor (Ser/Thr protein kinase)